VDRDAVVGFADFVAFAIRCKTEGARAILWWIYAGDATQALASWSASIQPGEGDVTTDVRFYLRQVFRTFSAIDSDRIRYPADLAAACKIAVPAVASLLKAQGMALPMSHDWCTDGALKPAPALASDWAVVLKHHQDMSSESSTTSMVDPDAERRKFMSEDDKFDANNGMTLNQFVFACLRKALLDVASPYSLHVAGSMHAGADMSYFLVLFPVQVESTRGIFCEAVGAHHWGTDNARIQWGERECNEEFESAEDRGQPSHVPKPELEHMPAGCESVKLVNFSAGSESLFSRRAVSRPLPAARIFHSVHTVN
jgi:hypothetical protein